MMPLEFDEEKATRAVFLAQVSEEKEIASYERFTLNRPEVIAKMGGLRGAIAQHRAVWNAAEAEARAEKRVFAPYLGGSDSANRPVGGQLVFTANRMVRIGDADDSTPICTPYPAREIAERKRFAEAEREYAEHAEAETGMGASPEEWERQQAERSEVRRQSHELAHRLELSGRNAYRNEALGLWTYWVHSKQYEAIPAFRRICLLPYVAAMVRAPKLSALEYFLSRNPYARFWTFTSGKRCGLDKLRGRIQDLHHRLNRLNEFLRTSYNLELVFRSTELGTVEFNEKGERQADDGALQFDANGEPLFHVHAHCVLISHQKHKRTKADWSAIIAAVGEFWGDHWDAGNIIADARECCKYVTKPGDMLKLTPDQLGRLSDAVSRLKLCQPLGVLADEIRARKEAGKTLRRYRTREGMVWREVFDHNKCAAIDEEERWAAFELERAQLRDKIDAKTMGKPPGPTNFIGKAETAWCRVFSRLSPSVGPLGLKEPRVIVGGTRFDLKAVQRHDLVQRLWSQTVEAWEAGRAIRVHTGTPTVREFGFLADVPERMEPPDPDEIEARAELAAVLDRIECSETQQTEFAT